MQIYHESHAGHMSHADGCHSMSHAGHMTHLVPQLGLVLATAVVWRAQVHGDGDLVLPRRHVPLGLAGDGMVVIHLP